MKITLVIVTSLNGKTTKGNQSNTDHFASKEDQEQFNSLLGKNHLLIMGSKTYEAAKNLMQHEAGRLRVILTRNPNKYAKGTIPSQLEFINEEPKKLIEDLEKKGYLNALLLGGEQIYTLFLKAGLVDEILITIEPKIFGIGNGFVNEEKLETNLELIDLKKLNSQGTLLLKYKVIK